MLASFIALLSAATFGLNNAAIRRGVLTGSVLQALFITVPIGILVALLFCLAFNQLHRLFELPLKSVVLLSIAGVLHFIWGRYFNYKATKEIGANLVGPWRQSNQILSLVLAVFLLGELVTPLKLLGVSFIVFGMLATSRAGTIAERKQKSNPEDKVRHNITPTNYTAGYSYALLAAAGYGVSPILIREALIDLGAGYSLVGSLMSYGAATVLLMLIIFGSGNWSHVVAVTRASAKWFTLGGVLVGISQVLRFVALSMAPVTVVIPIQSTSSLFRVFFAWLINKEHEVFGIWLFIGLFFTLSGVLSLTLSLDSIASAMPFPDFIKDLMAVQWSFVL